MTMDYAQSNMLWIQKVPQLAKQTGFRLYLEPTGAYKMPSLVFDKSATGFQVP